MGYGRFNITEHAAKRSAAATGQLGGKNEALEKF